MYSRFAVAAWVLACLWIVPCLPVVAQDSASRIERLEHEVAALKEELAQARAAAPDDARLVEIERRIDILAAEIESLRSGQDVVAADEGVHGLGPAASKVYRQDKGVSIGGYGEMLYQSFDSTLEDGTPSGEQDTLDFLRAIVYFGYKFNDRFLFNSEIEFEHASTEDEGEVSVEFAYIDFLWKKPINVRAGLLLVPMGFLNELHEPTVFLGTRRPETERRIIPSTWRENGAGIFGDIGGFSYRTYVVNGFDATGFAADGLRDGRQNGSEAKAEDFGWTGRLDYVGTPGLRLGISAYHGNSGQGLADGAGTIDVPTTIVEGHAEWRFHSLELRALAARAELDDVARLDQTLGLAGSDSIGENQIGGYVEAGFDVLGALGHSSRLVPYVRWETLDTQDEVPVGFTSDPANDIDVLTIGVAYQPIRQLVLKVDYLDTSNGAKTGVDQINASLGYVF